MFTLVTYTPLVQGVMKRARLPGTYPTASAARAAGVALLGAAPHAIGFEIEHTDLQAANDSATAAQHIERAKAARKARATRKTKTGKGSEAMTEKTHTAKVGASLPAPDHEALRPTCIASGQGVGQRCTTGMTLWRAYSDQPAPIYPPPPPRPPAPPAPQPDPDDVLGAPDWSDAETGRYMARVSHMANRIGMHPQRAEVLAYMLLVRDREGDDRRLCVECQHRTAALRCTQWRQLGMAGPMLGEQATMLQRCQGFRGGEAWA